MQIDTSALEAKFGKRLQLERKLKGLTQARLCKLAGAGPGTVAKLEQGKNRPQFDTLISICAALGVSPDVLVGWPQERELDAQDELAQEFRRVAHKVDRPTVHAVLKLLEQLGSVPKGTQVLATENSPMSR